MPNPIELKIGTVSKPIIEESTTYNIDYDYQTEFAPRFIPTPIYPTHTIGDLQSVEQKYVCALGNSQLAYNKLSIIGTDCEISGAAAFWWADKEKLPDERDPHCNWRIRAKLSSRGWDGIAPDSEHPEGDGRATIINMPYGLLPSNSYHASSYSLQSVELLGMTINYAYVLLYHENSAGAISEENAAWITSYRGNKAPIAYEATLKQKFEPYDTIIVTGSSVDYTVNYPVMGVNAAFYIEKEFRPVRKEVLGTVQMSETPEN